MGVTFQQSTPSVGLIRCSLCDGSGRDYNDPDAPCWACYGDGTAVEDVHVHPPVHLANVTAWAVVRLLELGGELEGRVAPLDAPRVLQRWLRVANGVDRTAGLVREPEPYDPGLSRDDLLDRCARVTALLRSCQKHGQSMVWF